MADLARRTQSRSIGGLIASAATVAVLSEAGSGPDKFLHIGNGVIAVLDTSLQALTEPFLIKRRHVGHRLYRRELIGHDGGKLSLRFGAREPMLVDLLQRIEKFLLLRIPIWLARGLDRIAE